MRRAEVKAWLDQLATERGVVVRLSAGRPIVRGFSRLSSAERETMKGHKAEIVEILLEAAKGPENRHSSVGKLKKTKDVDPAAGEDGQRNGQQVVATWGRREPRRLPLRRRVEVDDGSDRSLSRIGLDRFHFGRFVALPSPDESAFPSVAPTVHRLPGSCEP